MTRNFEKGDCVSIFVEEINERLSGSLMCYSLDGVTALVKTQFGPVWGFARTLKESQYSIPWWYWTIRPSELDGYINEQKRKTAHARMLMSAMMIVGRF